MTDAAYQANGAEILPCDRGWVVILRLWDQVTTTVAETPERLREILDGVEWKPRGEQDVAVLRRLREKGAQRLEGSGSGASAEAAR